MDIMVDNIFKYEINDGFLWSEVNLKGEKKYYVEGYASTIDEDKAGEILDMQAQQDILNQIQNENITMDIEHGEWYDEAGNILQRPKNQKIPVAKIVYAEMRPKGVWVKAQINTNLGSFNEVWGSIKDGFLKAFSIAFYPVRKAGKVISNLNLVNVTLTGSPVNPNATFNVSMKSAAAWMDSQEQLKAEFKPKLDNPADTQSVDSQSPKAPESPETKSEDTKMKCKDCDKEFDSKELLEDHYEKSHGKEEKGDKKEDKKEEPKMKAEEAVITEPVVDVKAVHEAELKALQAKYDEAVLAHSAEVAKLKAELEKPVMKAEITKEMPKAEPMTQIVAPLGLIR